MKLTIIICILCITFTPSIVKATDNKREQKLEAEKKLDELLTDGMDPELVQHFRDHNEIMFAFPFNKPLSYYQEMDIKTKTISDENIVIYGYRCAGYFHNLLQQGGTQQKLQDRRSTFINLTLAMTELDTGDENGINRFRDSVNDIANTYASWSDFITRFLSSRNKRTLAEAIGPGLYDDGEVCEQVYQIIMK